MNTFSDSNFGQFLATRKFWVPIIATINMLLIYAVPRLLAVEIDAEIQSLITKILWGIAGLVVFGDIGHDWLAVMYTDIVPDDVDAG